MDFHPRRVTRHNQRNRMIFIAWSHRMDGALMQVVREYRPGSEHLCALDHDPIITFLNDATIQVRRVLLMRLLGSINLGRHDRVGNVDIIISQELVYPKRVIGKLFVAFAGQNLRRSRKTGAQAPVVTPRPEKCSGSSLLTALGH